MLLKKWVLILTGMLCAGQGIAQDSLGMRRVGALVYWQGIWDMEIVGSTAYVAGCVSGLHILDFSNTGAPVEIATYDSVAYTLCMDGSRAYVTNTEGGVVYDIMNPAQPQEIGRWRDGMSAIILVHGNHGVTMEAEGCPFVLDVSDLGNIHVVGNTPFAPCYARPVGVAGEYFALIGHGRGFRLFNLSIPEQPVEVSSIFPNSSLANATVSGNYAYLAAYYAGLRIVDLTDPLQPVHIATADSGNGNSFSVAVAEGYALVGKDSSVTIWNVTDPANPFLEGSLATNTVVQTIYSRADFAYVRGYVTGGETTRAAGAVIDISNPAAPNEVGRFGELGYLSRMAVADSLAYAVDDYAGLRVINLSDPAAPVELGASGIGNFNGFADVAVSGNYAYIAATNWGLVVIDVSNPAQPHVLSNWHPGGYTYWTRILAVGDYVYVADDYTSIHTFSLADPALPQRVDTMQISPYHGRCGLAVYENYLCVVHWDGFHILSLANPAAPVLVGSLYREMGRELTISGHYAFVGGEETNTRIVDLANPSQPVFSGEIPSSSRAVAARRNILITKGAMGLRALDITDPLNAQLVGFYEADEGVNYAWIDNVKIVGNYAVTAAAYRLRTYECDALLSANESHPDGPQAYALHPCYPNPFNATTQIRFALPHSARVELDVFDVEGRLVRQLATRVYEAGTHTVIFEAAGRSSGMYFVRMQSPEFVATQKMVLLK